MNPSWWILIANYMLQYLYQKVCISHFYESFHKPTCNRITRNFCLVPLRCFQETVPQDSLKWEISGSWWPTCSHGPAHLSPRTHIVEQDRVGSVRGDSFPQTHREGQGPSTVSWPLAFSSQPTPAFTASVPDWRFITTLQRSQSRAGDT